MIGIEISSGNAYEGSGRAGRRIVPAPTMTIATLLQNEADASLLPRSPHVSDAEMVFREDSYDPVTRMRRGRLYSKSQTSGQPENWYVHDHELAGARDRQLYVFAPHLGLASCRAKNPRILLALGADDAVSIWRIIEVERTTSGEDLLTLRARSVFGALPDVIDQNLPEAFRADIAAALERVADGAFRVGPVSLVDLCRDATTVVLSRWLVASHNESDKTLGYDLGKVVEAIGRLSGGPDHRATLVSAAKLIQRFHSRGKSNERHARSLRPISEGDAELALNALGFILRELDWARD